MRLFIAVAFLVGLASCGDFMLESTSEMFGKWSKFKAMETCFGEEVTRNYMLKLKKAHAKCLNVDLAPEAQLEMSQSSTKFIRALLDGSAQVERDTLAKLKDAIGSSSGQTTFQHFAGVPYPVPFPYAPFQQQQSNNDDDFMTDMMRKMFMKKMMKKMFDNKKMSDNKNGNNDENDKDDSDGDDEDGDLAELLFTKGPFHKMMSGSKKRNRRDEEEKAAKPDLFGLGERLNAKLTEEKAAMSAKLSNYSCILQELKIVDQDNELNLDGILEEIQNTGINDQWLLDSVTADKKLCYAKAQALPTEVLEACTLGPKWVKIKEFMTCCKETKMKTCMAQDTRNRLTENFGSVEKLRSQTGLGEKEMLTMAMKLVFGSMEMD